MIDSREREPTCVEQFCGNPYALYASKDVRKPMGLIPDSVTSACRFMYHGVCPRDTQGGAGGRVTNQLNIMETTIITLKNTTNVGNDTQHMTSLEIAELTGKQHKDLLKAIRNMEPAWEKVQGRKFALLQKTYQLPNGGTKMTPCIMGSVPVIHKLRHHHSWHPFPQSVDSEE